MPRDKPAGSPKDNERRRSGRRSSRTNQPRQKHRSQGEVDATYPTDADTMCANESTPTAPTSDAPIHNPQLRRSARPHKYTTRGKEYFSSTDRHTTNFPPVGSDIKVKWLLDGGIIWWPASVLSIHTPHNSQPQSSDMYHGTILYRSHGSYSSERTDVVFRSDKTSKMNYVCPQDGSSSEASWFFADDPTVTESTSSHTDNDYDDSNSPLRFVANNNSASTDHASSDYDNPVSSAGNETSAKNTHTPQHRNNRHVRLDTSTKPALRPTISKIGSTGITRNARRLSFNSNNAQPSTTQDGYQITGTLRTNRSKRQFGPELIDNQNITATRGETGTTPNSSADTERFVNQLNVRVSLVESTLASWMNSARRELPQSVSAVLISLRWALVKSLERPLKQLKLPDLSKYGMAQDNVVVKTACDFLNFRLLAQYLETVYSTSTKSYKDSRLTFAPPFPVILSGSQSISDLSIVFATFSDMSTLLGVRDERDFENIMVKEVVNESHSFLRLFGSFEVNDLSDSETCTVTNEVNSIQSIEESSELVRKEIHLFIGSAPVHRQVGPIAAPLMPSENRSQPTGNGFHSVLLSQRCDHYSPSKQCFQSEWVPRTIQSKFNVACSLDADGVISSRQAKDHFLLTWSRIPSPSHSKWTRDMMETNGNVPGMISLSVPIVFLNSRHNIGALSSVLDDHIEDFMNLHKDIQMDLNSHQQIH